MTRGTFANVRIKNLMVPGVEGGVTKFINPDGEADVDLRRRDANTSCRHAPLVILAGQEYGTGSRATGRRKARACSA